MSTLSVPATDPALVLPETTSPSRSWLVSGGVAGLAGFLSSAVLWRYITPEVRTQGPDAIVAALVDQRVGVHLSQSTGWLAAFALVLFAVGLVRFVSARVPQGSASAAVAQLGLIAAFGSLTVTAGLKSVVAGGIPGAIDAALYLPAEVATFQLLVDQAQWFGWMGVMLAAAAVGVAGLRHRAVSRWFAFVSVGMAGIVAAMTLFLGLPYSAGIVAPVWLVIASLALARRVRD